MAKKSALALTTSTNHHHGFTGIQYGQKVFQPRISYSHDLSGSSLDQLSPGLSRTQKSAAVLCDEIIFPSVIPRSFLSHERSKYTLPQFQISSQSRPRSFENSALFNPAGLYATTPTSGSTMSIPIPIHIQHYDYVALTTSYQISIHLSQGGRSSTYAGTISIEASTLQLSTMVFIYPPTSTFLFIYTAVGIS